MASPTFRKPRRPENQIEGLVPHIAIALVVGFLVASLTKERANHTSFWTTLLATGAVTFFIVGYIREVLLKPRPPAEVVERDSDELTGSIRSSLKSSYAISSNWLSLWRSPSFRYYLHLDATTSLIAHCELFDSSLARLSTDTADQQRFYDEGWQLATEIGANRAPLSNHRVRLLIYPAWVYTDYANEILQLIRSHSAGRIPCLPLVADDLYGRLTPEERDSATLLVERLGQTYVDKGPPRGPLAHFLLRGLVRLKRVRRRLGFVFPDMLLIDADIPHDTSAVWWYSRNGTINRWGRNNANRELAVEVFRALCRHARDSSWPGYGVDSLGGVAVTLSSDRLESEAFFARGYYEKWLEWIDEHHATDVNAGQLHTWFAKEFELLGDFVSRELNALGAPNGESPDLSGRRLLDIGCGFGRHLLALLEQYGDLQGIGVDINERMINGAIARAQNASGSERATFLFGDVATLAALGNRQVDLAICMTNTLGNLPPAKQKALVERLRAVVRPGGRVLFSVYSRASVHARLGSYRAIGLRVEERENDRILADQGLSSQAFSQASLRNLLEDNGLSVVGPISTADSIGLVAVATPNPSWS